MPDKKTKSPKDSNISSACSQVEERLRESEHWLKEAQRIGRMGSYFLDIQTGIWTSSEVLDDIFGIDASFRRDITGWANIVHPDHRAMMVEYFQNEVLKQHKPFDKEYMVVRQRDQAAHWVHGYGELVFDGEESPIKMIGTIQDITPQKELEEKLAKINRQSLLILDSAAEGILGLDSKGDHIFVNPAAAKMLGYATDELIGHLSHTTWHHTKADGTPYPHEECRIYAAFRDSLLHRSATEIFWRKDGSSFPVEWASTPIIENGQATGTVVTFTDISERLESEMKLKKSENYLRAIINNEPECVKVLDKDGNLLDMNPAGLAMLEADSLDQLKGQCVYPLITPEYRDKFMDNIRRVFTGETISDEFDMTSLKGAIHHMETHAAPLRDETGKIIAYMAITRDITTKKEDELHIKDLSELRSKFITIISHQLRTPLTSINWNLEMLLNGSFGRMEETQHKFLHATHEASLEVTRRIHDLLLAMDIEEGRTFLEKEDISFDGLCSGLVNEMTKKAELKDIVIECATVHPDLPIIEGDGEKIRTVIRKLMENAIAYTPEKGRITVKMTPAGLGIRFEVTDTGIGIPKSEQHHVFERFFRASNASVMLTDAFGLGLFISKHIIDRHGGLIGFESEESKGSRFWFELPIKK